MICYGINKDPTYSFKDGDILFINISSALIYIISGKYKSIYLYTLECDFNEKQVRSTSTFIDKPNNPNGESILILYKYIPLYGNIDYKQIQIENVNYEHYMTGLSEYSNQMNDLYNAFLNKSIVPSYLNMEDIFKRLYKKLQPPKFKGFSNINLKSE